MGVYCARTMNIRKTPKGDKSLCQPPIRANKLELRPCFWRVGESAALLDGLPLFGDHSQCFISIPGDP